MNLSEIKILNEAIDKFYKNYNWLLENKHEYFSVEDYIDNLHYKLERSSQHFNFHYPFRDEIFTRLEQYHLISFQPADPKHGFIGSLFRIDDELHLITKVGVEYKNGKSNLGVSLLFISFGGLKRAYDFCVQHEDLINHDVYEEATITNGFGF